MLLLGVLDAPASARMEIAVKPASGPVGTSITVTGSDYGANTVQIYWQNDKGEYVLQGEATVDDNRNFTFTFKAPEGKAGDHKIKVTPKGSTNPNNDRSKPFKITTGSKPSVEIGEGCTGDDHSGPYEDPNTGEPIDSPSIITVGASVDGAPEGAGFHMAIVAPDGTTLPIDSTVDDTGRVAGAVGIFTFGLYVATDPIVIDFDDPNTGQQVTARLDPSSVFPADGFEVGPQEVPCNAEDLPPGTLLVETPPPVGATGSQPPGTGSQPPPVQPPEQPPTAGGGGGTPVIWIVVIGGGVALIGLGTIALIRRPEPTTPPVPTMSKEGTMPQTPTDGPLPPGVPGGTQEKPPPKPPDPRGFDPKKQPFPEGDGIDWILEWKLDALIWNQFAMLNILKAIGWLLALGLAAIIGLLAAILAALQAGFALLSGLLAGIFALLAFFVIRLVVPMVMEREREKLRQQYPRA